MQELTTLTQCLQVLALQVFGPHTNSRAATVSSGWLMACCHHSGLAISLMLPCHCSYVERLPSAMAKQMDGPQNNVCDAVQIYSSDCKSEPSHASSMDALAAQTVLQLHALLRFRLSCSSRLTSCGHCAGRADADELPTMTNASWRLLNWLSEYAELMLMLRSEASKIFCAMAQMFELYLLHVFYTFSSLNLADVILPQQQQQVIMATGCQFSCIGCCSFC